MGYYPSVTTGESLIDELPELLGLLLLVCKFRHRSDTNELIAATEDRFQIILKLATSFSERLETFWRAARTCRKIF